MYRKTLYTIIHPEEGVPFEFILSNIQNSLTVLFVYAFPKVSRIKCPTVMQVVILKWPTTLQQDVLLYFMAEERNSV